MTYLFSDFRMHFRNNSMVLNVIRFIMNFTELNDIWCCRQKQIKSCLNFGTPYNTTKFNSTLFEVTYITQTGSYYIFDRQSKVVILALDFHLKMSLFLCQICGLNAIMCSCLFNLLYSNNCNCFVIKIWNFRASTSPMLYILIILSHDFVKHQLQYWANKNTKC